MCSETRPENDDIVELETYSNRTYSKRLKNVKSSLTRDLIMSYKKSSLFIFNDGCDTIASKSSKQTFDNDDDENSYKCDAMNSISASTFTEKLSLRSLKRRSKTVEIFNSVPICVSIPLKSSSFPNSPAIETRKSRFISFTTIELPPARERREQNKIDVSDPVLQHKMY
jgi:hypothetical protein